MMRAFLAGIVLLLVLDGCSFSSGQAVAVRDRKPVIEKPARPSLEKMTPEELTAYKALPDSVRAKLEGNNDKVQIYAKQLEVGVDEYNGYAKYSNRVMNESIGIAPEVKTKDGE